MADAPSSGGPPAARRALPAWHDPAWWSRFWEDVQPRFVLVRIRAGRVHIRWGIPLWVLEEIVRFALLVLPWATYAWRRMPPAWRGGRFRSGPERTRDARSGHMPPWHALAALLAGQGEGLLRLEPGSPFVRVEAQSGGQGVLVEITQL